MTASWPPRRNRFTRSPGAPPLAGYGPEAPGDRPHEHDRVVSPPHAAEVVLERADRLRQARFERVLAQLGRLPADERGTDGERHPAPVRREEGPFRGVAVRDENRVGRRRAGGRTAAGLPSRLAPRTRGCARRGKARGPAPRTPSSWRPAGSGIVALKPGGVIGARRDERAHRSAEGDGQDRQGPGQRHPRALACGPRGRPGGGGAASSGPGLPASTCSITRRASPTSRSRSFGSRARQRRRSRGCEAASPPAALPRSGSVLSTAASTSLTVSPVKSRWPVSISNTHDAEGPDVGALVDGPRREPARAPCRPPCRG